MHGVRDTVTHPSKGIRRLLLRVVPYVHASQKSRANSGVDAYISSVPDI